jgi:hypothetical protein
MNLWKCYRAFSDIQLNKVPEGNQPFFSITFLGHTSPLRLLSVFLKHAYGRLIFNFIDSQNLALQVETHAPFVQFWHIGITRSLNINLRIRAPLSHN